MTVRSNVRSWLYLHLYKSHLRLQLRSARKAISLQRLSCSLLDAEIRNLKGDLLQLGEDDYLDLVVECVARRLTDRPIPTAVETVVGDVRVVELLDLANKSDAVKLVLARYHAADAYVAGLSKDEARKAAGLERARCARPDLIEYDARAVYREHAQTAGRLTELKRELAERSALKMEFSISALSGGIALLSAMFLCAGFLYVRYFYRRMGVDAELYFSVGDYLAASIEQVRSGAFGAGVALLSMAFGVRDGSRRSRRQWKTTEVALRRRDWIFRFASLCLLGTFLHSVWTGTPAFYQLQLLGVLLSYEISYHLARAFFRNPLPAMAAIIGAFVFALNVGVSAYERSERLLAGTAKPEHELRLLFKDAAQRVDGELFGANSGYYFIYDRATRTTHVVARGEVARIDVINR
jgi:hypothetical protein